MENFGRGGQGNDAVVAYAQSKDGTNNANFATPPDGRAGRMRMYLWDASVPFRDGDLEGGIIVHEMSHGLSIRLTGGPSNSGCLSWGESGGMGEGWGDVIATMMRMTVNTTREDDFAMGTYAANKTGGIRKYPYSTRMERNPHTYTWIDRAGYWGVHQKGEVWAVMLFEVYWNLVDAMGFTPDWRAASLTFGNTLMLRLVVDGMKLQPCRPSFLDARDAMMAAEQEVTGGRYACLLWRGFAKRGLGVAARYQGGEWGQGKRYESYQVPKHCTL